MSHRQQTQAADIVLQWRNDTDVLRLNREDAEVGSKKIQASTGILRPRFLRTARKIGKKAALPALLVIVSYLFLFLSPYAFCLQAFEWYSG
jgi:hypothetical protein